jgi:uronate dehydrogenase
MPAPAQHKILITGSAGRIGKAAAEALLARGHFVRGLDLIPSPHASESIVGDIGDFTLIENSARGMDTLIHLAATPDDDDFITKLLPNNIVPVHHILEAARLHRINRTFLASSGQVNWFQQRDGPHPVRVTDPPTPRYWYAVTKIFAEYAGMTFARAHHMDIVTVRLGACPRDRASVDGIGASETIRDVYLSPADAGRFFVSAVEAPGGFGFQVVFANSKPILRHVLDPEPARRLFGYEPQDQWPIGIPPEIIGSQPIPGVP